MLKLIKFGASWCMPCKSLSRVMEGMDISPVEVFEEVDIDKNVELTKEYAIKTVPTLILLRDGTEVSRMTGTAGPARVMQFINAHS